MKKLPMLLGPVASTDDLRLLVLHATADWWNEINASTYWQESVFFFLAAAYALIATVALVQLLRIHRRVREYGWTTQKVFHLLNFLFCAVRAGVFFFRESVEFLRPEVLQSLLLDLPGLLFFSTYTLLVLFWAEIYHQALSLPTNKLKPTFLALNAAIYIIQMLLWVIEWWRPVHFMDVCSGLFFAGVSFLGALGFLLYGGRLWMMLNRFPIHSKGRVKKLNEVGWVAGICFTCFALRSAMVAWSAVDKKADLHMISHPLLNLVYFMFVEILPSSLVLYILRKLPARRASQRPSKFLS